MSHPIPGHSYGEHEYRDDSPHKNEYNVRPNKMKLNKTQRSSGRMLKEAGKHVRKTGESYLDHLTRISNTKGVAKRKALDKMSGKENK